ncbi:MAG: PAS domain S-box protein [Verrucomicrobia bacterium]|nr:PAS domain S-box protein [Verrucomicrobiota bacterium]
MKPPAHPNEIRRLEVLWHYGLLDTPPEVELDEIASIAARLCRAPIALISLIDQDRQWFKARHGLELKETPRDIAFCAHAILGSDLLIVPDTLEDARFRDNPLVQNEPRVRFYAGAPLITSEGFALGTLCILDRCPRNLDPAEADALRMLSRLVMRHFEWRRLARIDPKARHEIPIKNASTNDHSTPGRASEPGARPRPDLVLDAISEGLLTCRLGPPSEPGRVTLLAFNAVADRLLKLSLRTRAETELADLIPGFAGSDLPRQLADIVHTATAQNLGDLRFLGADQDAGVFAARAFPLESDTVGILFESVADRRLAEQAQLEGQARKSAILDSALDAIVTFDHEGLIFEWNRAAESIFGLRRAQVLGRELAEVVFPGETRDRFRESLARYLQNGDSELIGRRVELIGHRSDGGLFPLEMSVNRVPMDGPPLFTGFLRDITERNQFEEALRRSEEHFRSLIENSSDVIVIVKDQGRLSYLSHTVQRILNYRPEELIHRSVFELIHPDDSAVVEEALQRALRQPEKSAAVQFRCRHANGTWRYLEAIGILRVDPSGEPCVVVNARDITERRQLEDQLRQAQKMESVGQLAGGVAHDFNNILTVIQGHAALLTSSTGLTPKQRNSLEQITLGADRAANLTRQLLTFSRKQMLQPRHLDLNEVVNNLAKMLQRILGEDIALHLHFQRELPAVHADQGMVEQILMNLAVNSRDAMPRGGQLIINTRTTPVDAGQLPPHSEGAPGLYVILSVGDTGTGIADEHLPHIFEPFFTTKDVGKGTGLGLATVYGIVHQHRGWITVDSEPNRGTVFQIFLPASSQEPDTVADATYTLPSRSGRETILLVEDEAALRNLVKCILERSGYRVLEAESALSALEVWTDHHAEIDLLLTDMVMPDGMNGKELGQRLHLDKPQLKIIYSSGYSPDVVGENFLEMEGRHFLQKPYHPRKLVDMVRLALDSPVQAKPTRSPTTGIPGSTTA